GRSHHLPGQPAVRCSLEPGDSVPRRLRGETSLQRSVWTDEGVPFSFRPEPRGSMDRNQGKRGYETWCNSRRGGGAWLCCPSFRPATNPTAIGSPDGGCTCRGVDPRVP